MIWVALVAYFLGMLITARLAYAHEYDPTLSEAGNVLDALGVGLIWPFVVIVLAIYFPIAWFVRGGR